MPEDDLQHYATEVVDLLAQKQPGAALTRLSLIIQGLPDNLSRQQLMRLVEAEVVKRIEAA